MKFDPYNILGVTRRTGSKKIIKSYRDLARKYHPDMQTGNAEKFIEAKKAYDTLMDPKKKMLFDKHGLVEGDEVSDITFRAMNDLKKLFISFLQQVPLKDLPYINVVDKLEEHLKKHIAETDKRLKGMQGYLDEQVKALEILEKRLKNKKKTAINIFNEAFAEMVEGIPVQIKMLDDNLRVSKEQLRILQDFYYQIEMRGYTTTVQQMTFITM
jgi:curved DNA-binding protein CbpA